MVKKVLVYLCATTALIYSLGCTNLSKQQQISPTILNPDIKQCKNNVQRKEYGSQSHGL